MTHDTQIRTIQSILRESGCTQVQIDGDIGKITTAAVRQVRDKDVARAIQTVLRHTSPNLKIDGKIGPLTMTALALLDVDVPAHYRWNKVLASSFADPADVIAFDKCKATGKTDLQCFAVGDNGIGKWGHPTANTSTPMAALPREIWRDAGQSGGSRIAVRRNGVEVHGILGDTMPSLKNIKNGCGIDLNPAFAKALGLKPPFKTEVEWRWA